jgi:hypothetical protein
MPAASQHVGRQTMSTFVVLGKGGLTLHLVVGTFQGPHDALTVHHS